MTARSVVQEVRQHIRVGGESHLRPYSGTVRDMGFISDSPQFKQPILLRAQKSLSTAAMEEVLDRLQLAVRDLLDELRVTTLETFSSRKAIGQADSYT